MCGSTARTAPISVRDGEMCNAKYLRRRMGNFRENSSEKYAFCAAGIGWFCVGTVGAVHHAPTSGLCDGYEKSNDRVPRCGCWGAL
jgi:hypothetical protein